MNKKILVLSLISIMAISILGCSMKKNNNNDENTLNLYYNTIDTKSISYIPEIIKEYEKEEGIKINIVPLKSNEEMLKKITEDKESCLLLLDGYRFSDYNLKGILRELTYLFKSEKTKQEFTDISTLYGIFEGRNFGLGLSPYSVSLVYNKTELEKLGITVEENDLNYLFKKLNEKNIKIPTKMYSEYSKELLISALIANDSIIYDMYKLDYINDMDKKIYSIENGQKIFDIMNDLYNKNIIKENMFIEDDDAVKKFNEGKTPVVLMTTLGANDIKSDSDNIGVVDQMHINNKIVNSPILTDTILCSSVGSKNFDAVDKFFRYIINSGIFQKISSKNYITGNKIADSNLQGVQIKMANGISSAEEINKVYFNVISNKNIKKINDECRNVLSGKYDGKEWNRILDKK